MARKKILFLPKWYPNRNDPMEGSFVRQQAIAAARFDDVAVLFVRAISNTQTEKPTVEIFDDNGVKTIILYHKISTIRSIGKFQNTVLLWFYIKKGLKILNNEGFFPELVHVHILTRLGVIALWLRKWHHLPYLISEHWSRYLPDNSGYSGFLRKWLTKRAVQNAEFLIPVSHLLQEALWHHGLQHPHYQIVPNLTDTQLFQISHHSMFNSEKVNFLHVSCFDDASKNISGILNVLQRVVNQRDDIVLHLVGDGPDREKMEQLAQSLNLYNHHAFFYGLQEGEALARFFQSADCLVVFSNYETFCIVINESLACGVPIISTNTGCISERVNASNGILIEPKNEEQLFQAMLKMAEKKGTYDKIKLRQPIVNQYSEETIGKQLSHIYHQIGKHV